MATQTAAAAGPQQPDQQVTEREARFLPGLRMLVAGNAGLLAGVAVAVVASRQSHGAAVALVLLCVLIFLASALVLAGPDPRGPRPGPRRSPLEPHPRAHPGARARAQE